jgi:hypothetical protein
MPDGACASPVTLHDSTVFAPESLRPEGSSPKSHHSSSIKSQITLKVDCTLSSPRRVIEPSVLVNYHAYHVFSQRTAL